MVFNTLQDPFFSKQAHIIPIHYTHPRPFLRTLLYEYNIYISTKDLRRARGLPHVAFVVVSFIRFLRTPDPKNICLCTKEKNIQKYLKSRSKMYRFMYRFPGYYIFDCT